MYFDVFGTPLLSPSFQAVYNIFGKRLQGTTQREGIRASSSLKEMAVFICYFIASEFIDIFHWPWVELSFLVAGHSRRNSHHGHLR